MISDPSSSSSMSGDRNADKEEDIDSSKQSSTKYSFLKLGKGCHLEGAPVPYLCIDNAAILGSGAQNSLQVWML